MSVPIFTNGRNEKLADFVNILNLPPIKTCTNCKTCSKTCYANFRYRFPSVKKRWDRNLEMTKLIDFAEKASIELAYKGANIVRFHESGDFYNAEYIEKCYALIEKNPHIQFYGYTKNRKAMKLNNLPNCNIIYSFIKTSKGYVRNYGDEDYCNYLKENYNAFVCPHNDDWKALGKKCMSDCKECLTCKNVVFVEHGQNAKNDDYSKKTLEYLQE